MDDFSITDSGVILKVNGRQKSVMAMDVLGASVS